MPYTESKIIKVDESQYKWSVGGPISCFKRSSEAESIVMAWHQIRKKLLRIGKLILYPMDYSVLYRNATTGNYETYYYTLIDIIGDIITHKDSDKTIEVFCEEDIANTWKMANYNKIFALYRSSMVKRVECDNEYDSAKYSIHNNFPEDYGDYTQEAREDFFASNVYSNNDYFHPDVSLSELEISEDNSTNRQKDIVEWLEDCSYRKEFKKKSFSEWLKNESRSEKYHSGKGFYITRGNIIKLRNGISCDIIDWLKNEGFIDVNVIMNYNVEYTPTGGEYQEKFSFFDMV